MSRFEAAVAIAICLAGCRGCHDDDEEEDEERDETRLNYWRVQIAIVGQGRVESTLGGFACSSGPTGTCGPELVTFVERRPPLLRATGAPGWRFDHWVSQVRERDGRVAPRPGRMPDGRFYLNGFGYTDTGAVETVTAVFALAPDGRDDRSDDDRDASGLTRPDAIATPR